MVEARVGTCEIPNTADGNTQYMDEKYGFCIKCGQELPQGATFCPECGYRVGDSIQRMNSNPAKKPVDLNNVSILIFIYAAFAVIIGLLCAYIALQADVLLDMLKEMSPEEYQQLIDMGVTAEMMAYIYSVPAVMMIVSGALAAISGYLVTKRTNSQLAFVLCILASVTSFPLIITLIIGLIVSFKIKEGEDQFIN